jgi:hypothetical protein
MIRMGVLFGAVVLGLAMAAPAGAQAGAPSEGPVRSLKLAETGCDTSRASPTDSIYAQEDVDRPVEARRLAIDEMPLRLQEVVSGRSVFRFVIESSGRINRCTIELMEETNRAWTDAVLRQLRGARYKPALVDGRPVRQLVHQVFTYHTDGRLHQPQ